MGEEFYEVREVYYNADNKPYGHCKAAMHADDVEGLKNVLKMIERSLEEPILNDGEDFVNYLE